MDVSHYYRGKIGTMSPAQVILASALVGAAVWYFVRTNRPASGGIRRVESGRPDLLAFEVTGTIDKGAIQHMAQQALDAFDRYDEVDMIVLMQGFKGLTLGASFDPLNLWSQARSLAKVGRYAVVGAPQAAQSMINFMDHFIPVEARAFEETQKNRAWDWVRGRT